MIGSRFSKRNNIFIVPVFLILCIIGAIIFLVSHNKKTQVVSTTETTATSSINYSAELSGIVAKSYFVYDFTENKVLFAKNEHDQLPLASVTKLMSGFVILDTLPANTIVNITMGDIRAEGDSGLVVGEKWPLKTLLDFSLISSSNDGIEALTRTVDTYTGNTSSSTIALMNQKAKTLGLTDTFFINSTGLDMNRRISGAYSSAADVATLLGKILKDNPAVISQTRYPVRSFISLSNIKHLATNTNLAIRNIPNLIASKTGYTDLAGGNLAVAYDAGFSHPIISVVLGSTEADRFTDTQILLHATLQKLSE